MERPTITNAPLSFRDWRDKRNKPYKWIDYCDVCEGLGRICDPNYLIDPVEGYKFADYITCTRCGGKKTDPNLRELYDNYKNHTKMLRSKYKKQAAMWDRIFEKLTPPQRKFLNMTRKET